MRQLFAVLAVSALAVSLWAVVGTEPAAANHSWGGYHWARTSNPFTLKVGDNVSAAWDGYLDEAITDWSVSSVLKLTKVAGGTNPRNCRAVAGTIQACSSAYGPTGWLGLAQIWASGSHITQATTKVNDSYFNTATYNKPEWRRLVMCQEIAHDFGLDHQDEAFDNPNLGSCMDYTNSPLGPPSNEHPNQHDYDQIATIYAHLDATTTIKLDTGSGPGRGQGIADDAGNAPPQWGTPVRTRRDGRAILFRRDLGADQTVFTWVKWARPGSARAVVAPKLGANNVPAAPALWVHGAAVANRMGAAVSPLTAAFGL